MYVEILSFVVREYILEGEYVDGISVVKPLHPWDMIDHWLTPRESISWLQYLYRLTLSAGVLNRKIH